MSYTVHPGGLLSDAATRQVPAVLRVIRPDGTAADATSSLGITEGTYATPEFSNDGPVDGVLGSSFFYDFYYRVWIVPSVIAVQNPVIGTPIPFNIWNAFPEPATNALDTLTATNATGLTLDIAEMDELDALEYREVSITISDTAPVQINAHFDFDFEYGQADLTFTATLTDFAYLRPDPPITETWEWLTDVIVSRGNVEQRIALRGSPRRFMSYDLPIVDLEARRIHYALWYKSLMARLVLPYYQYSTPITVTTTAGASKIFFDPAKTDMRDGEYAAILNDQTGEAYLVQIDEVVADGATLENVLTQTAFAGKSIIAPALTSRLADGAVLDIKQVSGSLKVDTQALDVRASFSRPGSTATITSFDGFNVLDRRPTATDNQSSEKFVSNYELIDSQTGLLDIKSSWPHVEIEMVRNFTIRRATEPGELDWLRDFLDSVRGMQKAFLMPTWLPDLVKADNPDYGSIELTVQTTEYVGNYFPYDTFKRLQIELEDGTILYRKVLSASGNGDGTETLVLNEAFGGTDAEVAVARISYLNKCRLGSDTVRLQHGHLRTNAEITIRTIDQ